MTANAHDRSLLDSLAIASPCSADWSAMTGDDKRRFCSQCRLHVHDLSAMTADEALALLRDAGQGRLCVRFHRRADGKVLTQDCPVGLRRRLRRAWVRAAACASALFAAACGRRIEPQGPPAMGGAAVSPPRTMGEVQTLQGDVLRPVEMGKVRAVEPPAANPGGEAPVAPVAPVAPPPARR